jgi:hypothetical protein
MTKACRRASVHQPHPVPIMTLARVHNMDDEIINVEIHLCAPCRVQAGAENARALSRRAGKGVS